MSIPLYILRRLLSAIPTILIISFISFFMMRFDFTVGPIDIPTGGQPIHVMDAMRIKNPIDPLAGYRNNPQISPAAVRQQEKLMGLDKPFMQQYLLWLSHMFEFHPENLMRGDILHFWTPDFGKTFSGEDVVDLIQQRAGNTLILNIVVVIITWLIAVPPGVFAALNWRSLSDRTLTILTAIGMSFPDFVLALVLGMLAVKYGWPPFGGAHSQNYDMMNIFEKIWDRAIYLILPVFVLTIMGLAGLQRQMRANLLDVIGSDYIRTARAKGLPERTVVYKHGVRNALNPLISIMGLMFADLLSGALLIEKVFNYPGLGQLTWSAVIQTDTNLVMASLIMASVLLIFGNLMADICLKIADPRVELEG